MLPEEGEEDREREGGGERREGEGEKWRGRGGERERGEGEGEGGGGGGRKEQRKGKISKPSLTRECTCTRVYLCKLLPVSTVLQVLCYRRDHMAQL